MTHRRSLLTAMLAAAVLPAGATAPSRVTVWRDPDCGCCTGWVAHLRQARFAVDDQVVAPVRRRLGTPAASSRVTPGWWTGWCWKATCLPPRSAAVRRALAARPAGFRGLAVPAMPVGSPGMEVPGAADETYDVVAFGDGPHRTFMRFVGARPA